MLNATSECFSRCLEIVEYLRNTFEGLAGILPVKTDSTYKISENGGCGFPSQRRFDIASSISTATKAVPPPIASLSFSMAAQASGGSLAVGLSKRPQPVTTRSPSNTVTPIHSRGCRAQVFRACLLEKCSTNDIPEIIPDSSTLSSINMHHFDFSMVLSTTCDPSGLSLLTSLPATSARRAVGS
jgi:hypothetical protein